MGGGVHILKKFLRKAFLSSAMKSPRPREDKNVKKFISGIYPMVGSFTFIYLFIFHVGEEIAK